MRKLKISLALQALITLGPFQLPEQPWENENVKENTCSCFDRSDLVKI